MIEITIPAGGQGVGGLESAGTVTVLPVQLYDGAGATPTFIGNAIPAYITGGTVQSSVSFTGSITTDIGQVKIEDALGNLAVVPTAVSGKTGSTNALVVQHIDDTGTPLRQATQVAIYNAQGTLATAANQATQSGHLVGLNTTASHIMNNQGTLALESTLSAILNNQGTAATLAQQTVQSGYLAALGGAVAVTMNNQGTLASKAGVAVVANNQGTLATAARQDTTNTLLGLVYNAQGTAAATTSILTDQIAYTVTTYGPTGTQASAKQASLVTIDPNSVSADAFSRLRVSNPDYRFDGQLVYQLNTDLWDTAWNSTGTATYDRTNRMAQITCAASGTAVMQSHYYAPYTPGRSQLAFITFAGTEAPAANTYHRVGYYDGSDGIYLERTASGIRMVLKSSTDAGTETVEQANWNMDKLNGTGPSGLTLDLTKSQIIFIQLQALYIGRVIVGFDIDGVPWPAHAFTHANKFVKPYIANASLPVRYEVGSTGANTAQLNPVCASVISEGGGPLTDIPARTHTASNGVTTISVNARRPILSIRNKKLFNQLRNEGIILPSDLSIRNATADVYVELIRNGVLNGPAWVDVDPVNSVAEYDVAAIGIIGGQRIYSGYSMVGSGLTTGIKENLLSRLVIVYSDLLDVSDTLSVVCSSVGGAAATVASLNWKEIR